MPAGNHLPNTVHAPAGLRTWGVATGRARRRYLESVRRYNYTTPKSYLELISLYKSLLAQKRAELRGEKERLESGVDKISQASAQVRACRPPGPGLHAPQAIKWNRPVADGAAGWGQVADLQVMLSQEQIVVEEKKAATQLLIESIGKEKAVVDEAVESSRGDEEAAARLQVPCRPHGLPKHAM